MSDTSTIGDLIEPLVTAAGYELYDVQQNGGTLAVLVQGPDGVDIGNVDLELGDVELTVVVE